MHTKTSFIILGVVFTALLIGSNFFVYSMVTSDYTNKITTLTTQVETLDKKLDTTDRKLDTTEKALGETISNERLYSVHQRALLENKTLANFKQLQDVFNQETTRLELNLQSQATIIASEIESIKETTETELKDVSRQVSKLKKKSVSLESKIAEIDVTSSDFSAIVEDVITAVVSVQTDQGQGSGVIFDSRGYLLTNKHVIDGASSVQVVDYTGTVYAVQVIGTATTSDLAVLKIIDGKSFNWLSFATSSKVGERVIAIGNPLGLSFTVTEGIISAKDRIIDETGIGYIQTDVPINPGNSGGPLVNTGKQIVGINTLKASQSEGIGFAIPASIAANIANQAVEAAS